MCRSWRAVALSTPELWSFVTFAPFYIPKGRVEAKLSMLEYWLKQGAAHPLYFTFHYRQPLDWTCNDGKDNHSWHTLASRLS